MAMNRYPRYFIASLSVAFFCAFGQQVPQDWHLLDPETDGVQGLSVEKAYRSLLKGRTARPVIVAVIDSGIDPDHEDLKSVIWTNSREVAGNGRDDDGNGYTDDIHGWSFISGKGGDVGPDSYEVTREFVRLDARFANLTPDRVRKSDMNDYAYYQTVKARYEEKLATDKKQYDLYRSVYTNLKFSLDTIKSVLGPGPYDQDRLTSVQSENPVIIFAKSVLLKLLKDTGGGDLHETLGQVKEGYDYFSNIVEHGLNTGFDPRPIVGDDYADKSERAYGTASVQGPDAEHGTHVAGIIAAVRDNGLGVRGIADHARIMILRAVPDGDERDKDIASAIQYAADNGARIINMSFGKEFSPDKAVVDAAVRYAERKGVLFVHAAGNDAKNIDEVDQYPSRKMLKGRAPAAWIEVGASGPGKDADLPAEFSNYGKRMVDVFAPGVDIHSTVPGGQYKNNSGTSMAAPAVAGVAAMLMSYFPDYSAAEIKELIVSSARRFDGLKVKQPGSADEVDMNQLCQTGGVVNAFEAVKLAASRQSMKTKR